MSNETNAGVTAPTEPLKLTLEEGLQLLAERRNGRRITYEVDTPDGEPCWVAWERYVTLGPADSWVDALEITLERPVVARDDAAELRTALADVMRAIAQHDDRGPHILPTSVWQRARAALTATEGQP